MTEVAFNVPVIEKELYEWRLSLIESEPALCPNCGHPIESHADGRRSTFTCDEGNCKCHATFEQLMAYEEQRQADYREWAERKYAAARGVL